jgi:ketosteroid isomerase-like protein
VLPLKTYLIGFRSGILKVSSPQFDTVSANEVETIQEGIAALNRGDLDGVLEMLDPDVELLPLRGALDGSVYRGHEGIRRWLEDMNEDWREFEVGLEEVRELEPGRLLVQATMRLRGRSGVALDTPAAWLCDTRAGRVWRIRFFPDSDAALAAAG